MVKIGLVGTGGMGSVHYANYQYVDDCVVTAVCGVSQADAENAAKWGLPIYPTITEMVEKEAVDLVDICAPTFLHHDLVMESLNLGKDTITEKPIALNRKDAREMLDTAREKGCLLFVAQVLQFTKEVQILRRLVQTEEFGKPLDAVFERLSACPRWSQGGWLFDKEKSGLLPFDLHIHDLDIIISLFGKPDSYTFSSCRGRGKDYPEQFRVNYQFGDLHVAGEAAWFNADIPWTARWRVYFENAMVINDGTTVTAYRFDHEPLVYDTRDEVMVSTGINVPPCGWFYNELKHFIQCVQKREPTPYVTPEQLLTVVEVLEDIGSRI